MDLPIDGTSGAILGVGGAAWLAKIYIASSLKKLEQVVEKVIKILAVIEAINEKLAIHEKDREILYRHDREIAVLNSYNHVSAPMHPSVN